MRSESSDSTTAGEAGGWGPNNELLHEFWPMEIPPLQTHDPERDPVELPIRVPMSFLTQNNARTE